MTRHPTTRLQRLALKAKNERKKKEEAGKRGKVRKLLKVSIEEREKEDELRHTEHEYRDLSGKP